MAEAKQVIGTFRLLVSRDIGGRL